MKNTRIIDSTLYIVAKTKGVWEFAIFAENREKAIEKFNKKFPRENFDKDWKVINRFPHVIQ